MASQFFNDISLTGLEDLGQLDLEDISSNLKLLEGTFENHIEELNRQSVGNITRTHLLSSTDDVEFIVKAIIDESSLKTQTEFINHWIAKMILCQKVITMLVKYLIRRCEHYKHNWKEYREIDQSDTFNKKRLFRTVLKTYIKIDGLCQNIGLAVSDYFSIYKQIASNISIEEREFTKPMNPDPEITVSERLSHLDREIEDCLLSSPEESILGFPGVRIELENFAAIKIQDKMRQNIRMKDRSNGRDVKYTSQFKKKDVFRMVRDLFPYQKEYDALDMIYEISSLTVHKVIPIPNYISWASWMFVLDRLEKNIDNLNPMDTKLESIITKLENEGKVRIVPSKWYK